jgi:hypothetical protein
MKTDNKFENYTQLISGEDEVVGEYARELQHTSHKNKCCKKNTSVCVCEREREIIIVSISGVESESTGPGSQSED